MNLSNTGNEDINLGSIAISGANAGDFSIGSASVVYDNVLGIGEIVLLGNYCAVNSTLSVGTPCSIPIIFTPQGSGVRTAVLAITDSAAGSPHSVLLSGTGINTKASFIVGTPTTTFAIQEVNGIDVPRILPYLDLGPAVIWSASVLATSITNTSTASINLLETISGPNAGDFSLNPNQSTADCAATPTLAAGVVCSTTIQFKPSAAGARRAALTVADQGSGVTQTLPLAGVGVVGTKIINFEANSHSFGTTTIGTPQQTSIVVQSVGSEPVTFTGSYFSGGNAADFQVSSETCGGQGSMLKPNALCDVTVTFTPSGEGYRSAVLNILDDAQGGVQTFAFTGVAVPATVSKAVSPESVDFGHSVIGIPVSSGGIKFNNYGNGLLTLTGLTFSGPNAADFHLFQNSCGSTLAPAATCDVLCSVHAQPERSRIRLSHAGQQFSYRTHYRGPARLRRGAHHWRKRKPSRARLWSGNPECLFRLWQRFNGNCLNSASIDQPGNCSAFSGKRFH